MTTEQLIAKARERVAELQGSMQEQKRESDALDFALQLYHANIGHDTRPGFPEAMRQERERALSLLAAMLEE